MYRSATATRMTRALSSGTTGSRSATRVACTRCSPRSHGAPRRASTLSGTSRRERTVELTCTRPPERRRIPARPGASIQLAAGGSRTALRRMSRCRRLRRRLHLRRAPRRRRHRRRHRRRRHHLLLRRRRRRLHRRRRRRHRRRRRRRRRRPSPKSRRHLRLQSRRRRRPQRQTCFLSSMYRDQ